MQDDQKTTAALPYDAVEAGGDGILFTGDSMHMRMNI